MNPANIMIVEDNTTVAEDCRECLEDLGYNISSIVASGEESIINAEKHRPDAVIMDIKLSGEMDGIQAAKQIYNSHNIPVVFLSAYSDNALLERAKLSGSFGYLVKPFDERELYTTLEVVLFKAKSEAEQRLKIIELQSTLEKSKILYGIKTICAKCKKIQDEKTNWNPIEGYIEKNSDVKFSHSICTECSDKFYGNEDWYIEMKKEQ